MTRPSPLHLEQGVSIFCPVPEHSGQACRKLIKPRLDEICPVPLQVEHVHKAKEKISMNLHKTL